MKNKLILMFVAEIVAVAVLRGLSMIRRDRHLLPRAGKVDHVGGRKVFRQPYLSKPKPATEDAIREHEIEGWTPTYVNGKIQSTPDDSPGA